MHFFGISKFFQHAKKSPCFFVTHESIDDDAVGRKRRNYSFNATHLDTYMYKINHRL